MKNSAPNPNKYSIYGRLTGFLRYRELLECEGIHFMLIGFLCLIGLLPFAAGVAVSVMTSSILLLIPSCIVGGICAGPFLAALYDAILRCLRDAPYQWWSEWKSSMKKNGRDSMIPGVFFCLFWGFIIFMGMMMWNTDVLPTAGTLFLYFFSILLFSMIFSTFWPQVVLFQQKNSIRLKNSILFCIFHFWRVLLVSVLQLGWIVIMVLFLPWSAFLLPFLGIWFIVFLSCFLLYTRMNDAFSIEEQIKAQFPEQVRVYEEKPEP